LLPQNKNPIYGSLTKETRMPSSTEIAYEAARDFDTDLTAERVAVMATLEEAHCPDVHSVWNN
jgi:hypothetical protein